MVKKSPKKKPKPATKKPIEQQVEHFSEEVSVLGERVGKHMERKGDEWNSWFHRTLGPIGPLVSSIFGLIVIVLAVWVLGLVNFPVGSGFVSSVREFIFIHLGWFFLLFLIFSYTSYLSRAKPRAYRLTSPITTAISVVFVIWLALQAFQLTPIPALSPVVRIAEGAMIPLFFITLIIGYAIVTLKSPRVPVPAEKPVVVKKPPADGIHRLYRSSKDKILGGVCGGVAEYLGVDPVIIRLLWIVGTFLWGFGIIAYIIAWIVIPRNPSHTWD